MNELYFKNIESNRITRTILGLPSSSDISYFIECKYIDPLDGEIITLEDIDKGSIMVGDDLYKISSLIDVGVIGFRSHSLFSPISEDDLINT